jgi:hypothetical protein
MICSIGDINNEARQSAHFTGVWLPEVLRPLSNSRTARKLAVTCDKEAKRKKLHKRIVPTPKVAKG